MVFFRLDLDGTVINLSIRNYSRATADEWCDVELNISSNYVNYSTSSELLLSDEIDTLISNIENLLTDNLTDMLLMDCVEPDFLFAFHPKQDLRENPKYIYVQEGYEIEDIYMEFIINFWGDSGTPTENSLHLRFYREEINDFFLYLKLINKTKVKNDSDIIELMDKEIIMDSYRSKNN